MLYVPKPTEASPQPTVIKVGPREITGRSIAHAQRTPAQRALLAASIVRGDTVVVRLTAKQAVQLTGANGVYMNAAKKLDRGEKRAVEYGLRPMIPRRASAPKLPAPPDQTLVNLVRAAGIDRILNIAVEVERT